MPSPTFGPTGAPLYTLPLILICMAQGVGYMTNYDRQKRSSRDQGLMIRSITGPNAHLYTCAMVLDQPELFYYADLPTKAFDGDTLDWHDIAPGNWVVLEPQELTLWQAQVPGRIKWMKDFVANRNQGYLIWYADVPRASSP